MRHTPARRRQIRTSRLAALAAIAALLLAACGSRLSEEEIAAYAGGRGQSGVSGPGTGAVAGGDDAGTGDLAAPSAGAAGGAGATGGDGGGSGPAETGSGHALNWADRHREIGPAARSLYVLVLAMFLLGLSGVVGVDGLLSVFVAGLMYSHRVTGDERRGHVAIDEALNQYLVIPVFVLLGVVLPWRDWGELGWRGAAFVLIALLVRRLPVVIAMKRLLQADWAQVVWWGWFGPIGVAAIFYLGHAHEQGATDPRLWAAGTLVVATSTLLHGLSAGPSRLLYRRRNRTGTGSRAGAGQLPPPPKAPDEPRAGRWSRAFVDVAERRPWSRRHHGMLEQQPHREST